MTEQDLETNNQQQHSDGLFKRHPKLSIFLVAGIFYAMLIGMVLIVLVLLIRG